MKPLRILLFSLIASSPSLAWAAACCGAGFAIPSIISGDDKAQMTTSYSFTEVAVDSVDSSGKWRKSEDHQRIQTMRVDGSHVFADRWQAGFTLPVVQRNQLDQSHSGLGDMAGLVGYEYLPDWNYNPWRPKGIGFLQLTLPTGKSRAESEIGGLDSRGNGFWSLGAGTLLTKAISRIDTYITFEVHHSFAKSFSNSQMSGELHPGNGGSLGLGGGYNLKSLRLGSSITWIYEDPIEIRGSVASKGSAERYATALVSASYLASDLWAITTSYSDQTLFGNPVNTSLGRTFAILIQRRWMR